MARTLRDPRPKPRAPQARLTTVFDPPRLFTSSRPKERARNKAAMERAWRRQELTEMVVARTVGRIPGASGGEAFFSRRHWDDPLRAAAEAAAEAARRNYDARGEWGSVAADLAARDAARKAAAAAARLVDAEEGRRGGGETEFDQLVREGFEALAIESDEDREAEEDGSGEGRRGFSFRKRASSDARPTTRSSRRAFGSDDDDSDDPYADFDRALREAARADEDPADAERSSRAAFALIPFEGAGVPFGGVGSNAPSDDPRRLMLERAAPLARSERPHSSHASRLRRGREPYPDRPMARGRFLRSGKGGAGMARGRQVAALEARREATLGQMRCLAALAEWEQLATLCAREWELSAGVGAPGAGGVGAGGDAVLRGRMAPLATQAAWHLGDWSRMETYSEALADARAASLPSGPSGGKGGAYGAGGVGSARFSNALNDPQPRGIIGLGDETSVALRDSARNAMNVDDEAGRGAIGLATDVDFFRAILAVHRGDVDDAREHIAAARDALGAELAALVTESYDRSYGGMIRVQQLTELEEVIEYTELGRVLDSSVAAGNARGGHSVVGGSIPGRGVDAGRVATRRETMRRMWRDRIYGVQRKVEVWQALLAVRSLVLPATEETGTWLKFASLNRKAGRTRQAATCTSWRYRESAGAWR